MRTSIHNCVNLVLFLKYVEFVQEYSMSLEIYKANFYHKQVKINEREIKKKISIRYNWNIVLISSTSEIQIFNI